MVVWRDKTKIYDFNAKTDPKFMKEAKDDLSSLTEDISQRIFFNIYKILNLVMPNSWFKSSIDVTNWKFQIIGTTYLLLSRYLVYIVVSYNVKF